MPNIDLKLLHNVVVNDRTIQETNIIKIRLNKKIL